MILTGETNRVLVARKRKEINIYQHEGTTRGKEELETAVMIYAEDIMRNTGWMKHQLESALLGEISITSEMQMTPPLWQTVKKN